MTHYFFTGEVTAEELRQRLDGAKERMLSQPRTEQRSQATNSGENQGGSGEGEERAAGGRQGAGKEETCLLVAFQNLVFTCYNTKQHNATAQRFRIGPE